MDKAPHEQPSQFGRRRFLALAGMGAVVVGLGPVRALISRGERDGDGTATGEHRQGLSEDSLLTYKGLVDAVGSVPGTLVVAGTAPKALARLRKEQATASSQWRSRVGSVLAGLDEPAGPRFVDMDADARLARLRAMLASEAGDDRPGSDAVALAAAPYHPQGFRWSRSAAELWAQTLSQLPSSSS